MSTDQATTGGWLRKLTSRWLWKLLSANVAEAVAAQLVQHNKDAEMRELARELLALCIRAELRASNAIAATSRLKAAADSVFNRPGAFRGGGHLARLAQINEREVELTGLVSAVQAISAHDTRSLQTASADELNARYPVMLRTTEKIDELARLTEKELDQGEEDYVRREEHIRKQRLIEEEAAIRRRDSSA